MTRPSVLGPVRDAAGRVAVLAPRAPHRTRFRFPELRAEAVSGRSGHPQGQRAWEGGAGLGGGVIERPRPTEQPRTAVAMEGWPAEVTLAATPSSLPLKTS